MPVIIYVPARDRAWLRKCAEDRQLNNRANGREDQRQSGIGGTADLDLIGVYAEYAWAEFLGVTMNWDTSGIDDGWDFRIGNVTFDVKGTRRARGDLFLIPGHQVDRLADLLGLAAPDVESWDTVEIVGWTTREDFLGGCATEGPPRFTPDTRTFPRDRLFEPDDIFELFADRGESL